VRCTYELAKSVQLFRIDPCWLEEGFNTLSVPNLEMDREYLILAVARALDRGVPPDKLARTLELAYAGAMATAATNCNLS
jgi:hypothetical protein